MRFAILLGQVNPLDFGSKFRAAGEEFRWTNAALVLAIIAAVGFGLWLALRVAATREKRGYRSPRRLFNELCLAHQLDRPSRALLKRLAVAHNLTPSRLFLDPERFDAAQLGGTWTGERPQLEQLRDTIFGRKLSD